MKRRGWIAVTLVLGVATAGAAVVVRPLRSSGASAAPDEAPRGRAPEGTRVRVQVLNATRTRGLAQRATRLLRSRGFDVVEFGTAREQRDSTIVFDRSGHPEWARLAAHILDARSESRPDSSRYVDVTVLIGASWRPPAEPFNP